MSATRSVARRRWALDPRLLIGIALVVVSVAGVVALVGAADRRIEVLAASAPLIPGDPIDRDDLLVRQVALDGATSLYLRPGDVPDAGLVSIGVVRAGELIPVASVGDRAATEATSIVLPISGPVSSAVEAGAPVDVWATASESSTPDFADGDAAPPSPPVVLSADAIVVRIVEPEGIVGAADGDAVEVLIPRFQIARLLQSIARGDALAVVPARLPALAR